MSPERWQRIKELFHAALDRPVAARSAFLSDGCDGDEDLRREVEELLAHCQDTPENQPETASEPAGLGDRDPASQLCPDTIGPYRVLRLLGEGGMGVVYLGERTEPIRQTVAVKVLKPGMDSRRIMARFEAERNVLAMMEHPHIARIFDAGLTDDRRPYFVMEYVPGEPITAFCDRKKLSIHERLGLFGQVCEAIQHAHQKGIIHRDVKPSNLLVVEQDGRPQVKVIDFGVAKILDRQMLQQTLFTEEGILLGTPEYMSPEQAAGAPEGVDTRSDVYSLGVILYQMLTGRFPYDVVGNMRDVLDRIMRTEPARPSTIRRQINDEVETIVLKCLSKERDRRYQSAGELARDIGHYLKGEPIEAKRDSIGYMLRKQVRRYKAPLAAGLAFLALLAGSLVLISVLLVRQRHLTADARSAAIRADQRTEQLRRTLYVHQMALADSAFRDNATSRLRNLLDEAPADLRGWEWTQLKAASDLSLQTFRGHKHQVTSVSFSPDGRWIVSGSLDGTVKLRDAESGAELRTLREHEHGVCSVAFSPDGRRIVSGGYDGTVRLWDARTGAKLHTLRGHGKSVFCVAVSPDGRRIVSGSQDRTAKLWDAETGAGLQTLCGREHYISSVAFSPDGLRIASGSEDDTLQLWDAGTGAVLRTLPAQQGGVFSVVFSPDGRWIVSGGADATVKLRDAETGAESRTLRGHADSVLSATFSRDGRRIISGSKDGTVGLWDAETGARLQTLCGHTNSVISVTFSPDGERILSGSADNTLKRWSTQTEAGPQTLRGHSISVEAIALSPDGRRIASTGLDQTVRLWDVRTGAELCVLRGHENALRCVAFSPDGRWIASAGDDCTLKLWDTRTGAELRTLHGHEQAVRSVSFSPAGRQIASGSLDHTVKLWDAGTGNELRTLRGHKGVVASVMFSPDGLQIVSGSVDQTVKLWDARTGHEVRTLRGHKGVVGSVAFSPDGRRIVSGSWDSTLKLWDVQTGAELRTFQGAGRGGACVSFSPDGRRIVSGHDDATVRIWDGETGAELGTLRGHERSVFSVSFSPDGRRVVSGGGDATVRIWDSAAYPQRVRERQAALAAAEQAEPLVVDLYLRLGVSSRVAAAIESHTDLNDDLRTQALNHVLMRCAGGCYGQRLTSVAERLPVLAGQSAQGVAEGVDATAAIDSQGVDLGILDPRSLLWYGEFLIVGGQADRAVEVIKLSIEQGGLAHYYAKSLGWALLSCARNEEAQAALTQALTACPDWSNGPPATADFDHWTAAYFLGLASQQQYVERWCNGPDPEEKQYSACYPWFMIGQMREIEGKQAEAIVAYQKSVALGNSKDASWAGKFAAYRLGILTGTIPPPATGRPATPGRATVPAQG